MPLVFWLYGGNGIFSVFWQVVVWCVRVWIVRELGRLCGMAAGVLVGAMDIIAYVYASAAHLFIPKACPIYIYIYICNLC